MYEYLGLLESRHSSGGLAAVVVLALLGLGRCVALAAAALAAAAASPRTAASAAHTAAVAATCSYAAFMRNHPDE